MNSATSVATRAPSDPFITVFVVYPGTTQLDFTGPLEVLSRLPNSRTLLASVDGKDVDLGNGLCLTRLTRLSDLESCSLLCVPGGYGTVEQLTNEPFLQELRRLGRLASYVTSVCTGSLLLGAAGLLEGKRAASHWAWRSYLTEFGARVDTGRVVRDGNVFTGGGVTAGIDMGLAILAELGGLELAETVQLAIEYAPDPPFRSGTPEDARPEVVELVRARLRRDEARRESAVLEAKLRWDERRRAQGARDALRGPQ